jgi:hypothetical protein
MEITVLAYLEPDEKEPDAAVRQVAAGLAERGHKTSILTIRHDVNELIEGLKARKPQLVFNLVESFGDDIMGGVIGVAGVLDLLQIPYTGGGPGEIFLQEDKALTKALGLRRHPLPRFRDVPRRRELRDRRQPPHAAVREAAAHGRVDRYRREIARAQHAADDGARALYPADVRRRRARRGVYRGARVLRRRHGQR